MVGYSFDHEFNDTFTVRQNLRFAENKTSQNSVYGYGVCSDPANAYSKQCAALAPADKGHYLARKYVVDDEKLQNFSVDTQLQSKFATGDIDHTLLTVSTLCVCVMTSTPGLVTTTLCHCSICTIR